MANQRVAPKRKVKVLARKWEIAGKEYVQDELTFFEKSDLADIVLDAMEVGVRSDEQLQDLLSSIGELRSPDGREAILSLVDEGTITPEVLKIGKNIGLVVYRIMRRTPDSIQRLYAIALSVPSEDQEDFFKDLRTIDDETGFGIFDTFVAQNKDSLQDFGRRLWKAMVGDRTSSEIRQLASSRPTSA